MKNLLLMIVVLHSSACAMMMHSGSANRNTSNQERTPQQLHTDQMISEKVNRLFVQSAQVDATDIRVHTEYLVVTLSGVVSERSVKAEAERLAASVRGVKSVNSQITVAK